MLRPAALVASVSLLACGAEDGAPVSAATDPSAPTWTHDVAPLVAENCAGCHRSDGLEVSLSDYESAHRLGHLMEGLVSTRAMPPWPPATDGDCPEFVGDRHLSQADVDLVSAWVDGGMPRGTGTPPPTPAPTFGKLDGISVVIGPGAPYQPGSGEDYRCFVVDPGLAADAFVTAYRVDAGPGVHHVELWEIPTEQKLQNLLAREAKEDRPGFPCIGWEGGPYPFVTVWGPIDPVRRHPEGTGIRLHAGKRLVMQVHYRAGAPLDRTTMGLVLADHVEEEARIVSLSPPTFILPPRKSSTSVHAEMKMTSSAKLWGLRAHMHYFGASATERSVRGSESQCLLSIPHWDPNWQLMYFWERPLAIEKGDVLSLDCTYDTSASSSPVIDGPLSTDEMCFSYYYFTGLPPE